MFALSKYAENWSVWLIRPSYFLVCWLLTLLAVDGTDIHAQLLIKNHYVKFQKRNPSSSVYSQSRSFDSKDRPSQGFHDGTWGGSFHQTLFVSCLTATPYFLLSCVMALVDEAHLISLDTLISLDVWRLSHPYLECSFPRTTLLSENWTKCYVFNEQALNNLGSKCATCGENPYLHAN